MPELRAQVRFRCPLTCGSDASWPISKLELVGNATEVCQVISTKQSNIVTGLIPLWKLHVWFGLWLLTFYFSLPSVIQVPPIEAIGSHTLILEELQSDQFYVVTVRSEGCNKFSPWTEGLRFKTLGRTLVRKLCILWKYFRYCLHLKFLQLQCWVRSNTFCCGNLKLHHCQFHVVLSTH